MKVAVGLRRVAAGKRTSGRRAAQIARLLKQSQNKQNVKNAAYRDVKSSKNVVRIGMCYYCRYSTITYIRQEQIFKTANRNFYVHPPPTISYPLF